MSRNLLNVFTLVAGLGVCVFWFFCTSLPAFIGLTVCAILWVVLGRILAPHGIFGSPILYYYRAIFIVITLVWLLFDSRLPPELHTLTTRILDAGFLVLVLGYAYANYREE